MFPFPFTYPWNCQVLNKPVTSLTCTSQQIARSLKPPSGLHLHPGHLPRSSPLAAKGLSDQLSPVAVSTRLAFFYLQQVPSNPQIHSYQSVQHIMTVLHCGVTFVIEIDFYLSTSRVLNLRRKNYFQYLNGWSSISYTWWAKSSYTVILCYILYTVYLLLAHLIFTVQYRQLCEQ